MLHILDRHVNLPPQAGSKHTADTTCRVVAGSWKPLGHSTGGKSPAPQVQPRLFLLMSVLRDGAKQCQVDAQ